MNQFKSDRRDFLKTVGGAGAVLATLNAAKSDDEGEGVGLHAANRNASITRFALEIEGVNAGYIRSASGGNAYAEVVTDKIGADLVARKHIGNLKYEDIVVTVGAGMSKGFYQWISETMDHKVSRHAGSIIAGDASLKEQFWTDFSNALITEIGLPALDASSKEAAYMTIKFAPEATRRVLGDGAAMASVNTKDVKPWLRSNFKIEIEGLDCSRVNKIEALVIKQSFVENPIGENRELQKEPAKLEFPNLVLYLPERDADKFFAWHEDFVIKGNNGQDQEKKGTLYWLTTDMKFQIGALTFSNLGIFKLTPDPLDAAVSSIRRVKAEMYCENMQFKFFAAT